MLIEQKYLDRARKTVPPQCHVFKEMGKIPFDDTNSISVEKFLKDLSFLRTQYTDKDIFISFSYHCDDVVELSVEVVRPETDEEYESRVRGVALLNKKADEKLMNEEQKERKEYERLKRKFGG